MSDLPLFGHADWSTRLASLVGETAPQPPRASYQPRATDNGSDRPLATTYGDLLWIVTHQAFRIGFLDRQNGKSFDHENIVARVLGETPPGALKRLGYAPDMWEGDDIRNAQIRYEEGRITVVKFGLRCKAWGHPDYPPVAVRDLIRTLAASRSALFGS